MTSTTKISMRRFDTSSISKLNGENYTVWRIRLVCFFKTHQLMEIVDGTQIRPAASGPDQENWDEGNNEALTVMLFTMTDEQVEGVFGCKTAPEMWDKLSSIYQSTSGENKQALWQKFYLIMADEKSPVKTMIQIQNIASQLRSLGIVIDDVAEVARVISSLAGDKYRQFREAWRSVDISKQSTGLLLSRLKTLELEDEESDKSKANQSYFEDESERAFSVKKPFSNCAIGSTQNVWINDSGADRHYCGRLDWFYEYEKYSQPISVSLADNSYMSVKGTGKVRVNALVNKKWKEIEIHNVKYVPGGANLLSENVLLDKGFEVKKKGNDTIVYYRNGKRDIEAERRDGLQVMKFKPIINREMICMMAHHNSEFLNKTADTKDVYGPEAMKSTKFKVDECMKFNSEIVVEKTVIFGTGELTKISEIEDLNCFVVTNETPSFCKPVMNVKDEIIATNITENNVKIPRYKNGKDYQSQRLISFAPEKENMFWLNELHTSHRALKYAINTDILHRPHRTKSTEEAPPEQTVIRVTRRDDIKKSNHRNPGKNKKKKTSARVLIPKNYYKFNAPWSEEFEKLKLFCSIRILALITFHGREVIFQREKRTHFRQSNYVLKKHNISEYQPRLILMQTCMQFKGSERATYEFALIVLLLCMHSNASEGISQYLKRRKSVSIIYGIGLFKLIKLKSFVQKCELKRENLLWSFIILVLVLSSYEYVEEQQQFKEQPTLLWSLVMERPGE
ncbi:hypothetical protein Fcan01_12906 [Folsomia candida]|uniref:Retrovirus-related Pol polyprotein from transposon TNT 1-94-like beta-barrel domain-containing protein n=1 Tax=Folsomia candida TaxID=158441 RepID=A0A226E0W6_FOLCA|nr:hypothetical protein Fcan01_12906 [Folsomia candida]